MAVDDDEGLTLMTLGLYTVLGKELRERTREIEREKESQKRKRECIFVHYSSTLHTVYTVVPHFYLMNVLTSKNVF